MSARVALLLRGVNVGRQPALAMPDLVAWLAAAGFADLRTYLRSGNAVAATALSPPDAERAAEEAIAARFHRPVAVLARTAADLDDVVAGWPFDSSAPATARHVVFRREPGADVLARLPLAELAPEQAVARGRELYLHLPDGMGRSRLAELLGRAQRKDVVTARNWNTVTALRDLVRG